MGPLIRGHEANAPCRRVVEIRTELQTVCQLQTAPPDGHTDHSMRDGCPFYGALPAMSHRCRECAPRHLDHARPVWVPWQAWSLRRRPRVARQKVRGVAEVVDDCRPSRQFRCDIASCLQEALAPVVSATTARDGSRPRRCRADAHGPTGAGPASPAIGTHREGPGTRAARLPSWCDMSATAASRSRGSFGSARSRDADRRGPHRSRAPRSGRDRHCLRLKQKRRRPPRRGRQRSAVARTHQSGRAPARRRAAARAWRRSS